MLAAGPGRRLHPLTEALPKTLLPLGDGRTILDVALANLSAAGLTEVIVVTGFAAERVEERAAELERRHGIRLELVYNDRAEEWNNAYSLWLARDAFVGRHPARQRRHGASARASRRPCSRHAATACCSPSTRRRSSARRR